MTLTPDRLTAIDRYRVLEDLDRDDLRGLVELAAQICDTPMATIAIFAAEEQHHVAAYGFDGVVCPLDDSLCLQLEGDARPTLIPDARSDPRIADNLFVDEDTAAVRLFATENLTSPSGVVFGSLCVADVTARELSDAQMRALTVLAERVVDALELHVRTEELTAALAQTERFRDDLKASNTRLQEFAAQVSHDLKTPLTSIGLSLELVHEQVVDSEIADDALWLLERAIRGSARMGTFIDRNLEFAAITGGMRKRDVDLEQVVHEVIGDLQVDLADVDLTVDGALPVLEVDPVQLRSVLQNLIHNASKYRDRERPLIVTVRSLKTPTGHRIEIEDNGTGLLVGDRDRVFEPHARAHPEVPGTGLGLDTARRLIEAHGGTIGLDAATVHGTVAWFELPD